MKTDDLVEFKRKSFVSGVLGWLLKRFEKGWDAWGWHVGTAWEKVYDGWYILESRSGGPEINYYSDEWLKANTRSHTWLDGVPDSTAKGAFLDSVWDKKYDAGEYFRTAILYLIRHYFKRRIPYLLNDRYTCWELAAEFFKAMGKPVTGENDCPMLPDMLKTIKNR